MLTRDLLDLFKKAKLRVDFKLSKRMLPLYYDRKAESEEQNWMYENQRSWIIGDNRQHHYSRNSSLTSSDVTVGSNKKVCRKCEKAYEQEAVILSRSSSNGCPICSGNNILVVYNNLAILNPELAKQWHPDKNEGLQPDMVLTGSSKKVWWICQMGHGWRSTIKNKVNGTGCPICRKTIIKE